MDNNEAVVRVDRFNLSVRLRNLFMPFELTELEPLLTEAGYIVDENVGGLLRSAPTGSRISFAGEIATRPATGSALRIQAERGIIGTRGKDIGAVCDDFVALQKLLSERLFVDLEHDARFFEFILEAECLVQPPRNALLEVGNLFKGHPRLDSLSELVGQGALTTYGVQLVSQNRSPQDDAWLDLLIKPAVRKPTGIYDVVFVFRDPELMTVLNLASRASEIIRQVTGDFKN